MVAATYVWLLVLLNGTPAAGYQVRMLYASELEAQCRNERDRWLAAFPEMTNLPLRLQCVKHDQKNLDREDFR